MQFADKHIGGSGVLTAVADPTLPEEVLAHLPAAEIAAEENLERIERGPGASKLKSLKTELRTTQTPSVPLANKVIRLRHIAGEWSNVFSAQTACASGCNHCCHIGTAVPRSEAKLISKAIGRKLTEPAEVFDIASSSRRSTFFGVPCTFLVEGKCSIYAHRPLVCRTLVNMDNTDLLCRLVPGGQVPVPYLNTVEIQGYFAYLTQSEQFADLREWFPEVE